jgi:hypothetical protein
MSCYKDLQIENQELRSQVFETGLWIQGLIDHLKESPDWISVEELRFQLDALPINSPFDD